MDKCSVTAAVIANLNQLDQLPFIKRQGHRWFRFKEKQRFLPLFRNLSYQSKQVLSKIFVFNLNELKKDNKKIRFLDILTQRQIINLQSLFQILNENMDQRQFSQEVQRIKKFEMKLYNYVDSFLSKHLLKYKRKDYLSINIYKEKEEFYIKGSFNDFNYYVEMIEQTKKVECPPPFKIKNQLVKNVLNNKYKQLEKMSHTLPFGPEIQEIYQKFYDKTYFLYDQFVLKLQVFNNYPLLRLKNYIPIKFQDFQTKEPLQGPIFSNSDPDCMYSHFLGYNADTIKLLQGKYCQDCQSLIQQLQENELLILLRDNILNPQRSDLYYNPECNRFKLLSRKAITVEQEQGEMAVQKIFYKTTLAYLNYYHFRINLKKLSNKIRIKFTPLRNQESFPLTFNMGNNKLMIIDPARGKFCQHYAFTDLRLYYASYDAETNLYKCPVAGCTETMMDGDIMYLREAQVLMDYAKFKCQECPQLVDCSQVVIDHNKQKLLVVYKAREKGVVLPKIDELIDYYKTLVDPYIPFADYSLGIKEKERKQKMQQYMFGGLREEMERNQMSDEQEDQFYQEN